MDSVIFDQPRGLPSFDAFDDWSSPGFDGIGLSTPTTQVGFGNGFSTAQTWGHTDSFGWNDGDVFGANVDPWYHPGTALDGYEIESTILMFDPFDAPPIEDSPFAEILSGLFENPSLTDQLQFEWPGFPIDPEVGFHRPPIGFDNGLLDPFDAYPFPGVSSFPEATVDPGLPGGFFPRPQLEAFTLPQRFEPAFATHSSFTRTPAGENASVHTASAVPWDQTLEANTVDFAKRVFEGGAKSLSTAAVNNAESAVRQAVLSAEVNTAEAQALEQFFSRLASDPRVSDESVDAARNSFFEARAYAKQSDELGKQAASAASDARFYGSLTTGTVDAISGVDRLLDAEKRIRDADDPREAYRIMWETAIRFPLDVLLAAENKAGFTGNLAAGYLADGASSNAGHWIADATFDSMNRWAHWLYDNGYIPHNRPPRAPLN